MENLEGNCSYRIMFLFIDVSAFELGKLCPRVGICFVFRPRGAEILTEKISGPGLARGMVTGQIDTCIKRTFSHVWTGYFASFKS